MLEWMPEEGSARVRDRAGTFQVFGAAIRQDLERLEQEGTVTGEHGGEFPNSVPARAAAMALHHQENMDKKLGVGVLAAVLVGNDETLILGAGTAKTEIATRLITGQDLTVTSNVLNHGAVPGFAVPIPGGQFKAAALFLPGKTSAGYRRNIFAAKLFLAMAGVALDTGLA